MQTAELIAQLSAQARTVPPRAAMARLLSPLAMGVVVSLVVMWTWLGIRPDLAQAVGTWPFWWKFFYTAWIAVTGIWLTERLGRPGTSSEFPLLWIALAFMVAVAIAATQLMTSPPADRMELMRGASSAVCPWRIVALSMPILLAALIGARRLAPVRPALCGIAAGLLAGASGAWIYAFHCNESAGPFIAIWYTLGIAATAALGGISGKWLLRW